MKKGLIVLLICFVTLSWAGWVSSAELTKLQVGRIGQASYYVTLFAADKKGFYKEQGLDVEIIVTPIMEMMQGLNTDALPIALAPTDNGIFAVYRGAKLRMVGSYIMKAAYDIIAQPEYKSVINLKGKMIGVPELKTALTIMVQRTLEAKGLGRKEYDIIKTGNNMERMAALKSKAVAAVPLADPANFMMVDEGYSALVNTADGFPHFDFNAWWVSKTWADKNEATLVKFLKAFIKAQQWVDDPRNKEEAVTLIEQEVKVKRIYAQKGYEANVEKYKTLAKNAVPDKQGIEAMLSILNELGEFKDKPAPPVSAFLDETYLQKAHKELGIK